MMLSKLQTDSQVLQYKELGQQLQHELDRAMQRGYLIPAGHPEAEKYEQTMYAARTTFDNLSKVTGAATAVSKLVETSLGMTVEGLLHSMSGNRDVVKAGVFGALAITNQHVRNTIKKVAELNKKLDEVQNDIAGN